jgi:hypothetical protein
MKMKKTRSVRRVINCTFHQLLLESLNWEYNPGHLARIGDIDTKCVYENLKGRYQLVDIGVDMRIILKRILKEN